MQELINSIKRPNLRIMGIEEREEVQAKGICNIFNKIITEKFPNLENIMSILVQEASKTQTDLTKIELSHDRLSLKQQAQRIKKEY
jgi:archaeosine-15-forming tRNA-guanine transglycosylase